jgi:hypothetical protein
MTAVPAAALGRHQRLSACDPRNAQLLDAALYTPPRGAVLALPDSRAHTPVVNQYLTVRHVTTESQFLARSAAHSLPLLVRWPCSAWFHLAPSSHGA